MSDTSQVDFTAWWAEQVATEFSLDQSDVASCYSSSDPYGTDGATRTFLKYGWAKGVNGTPTAYINGAKLDSVPTTVNGWVKILNQVYESQYTVSAARHGFLQK